MLAHNIHQESRTRDIHISQDITFESMLLKEETLDGLKQAGFYKPSPIQFHGIPLGKCGFDLLLEAKSGTGKTAVFSVIALEKLDLTKGLQTLILAPTREIAAQICEVITQIGSCFKGLKVEVVMGGLSIEGDIEKLKNPVHILVGSPGRLNHLIQQKFISTSSVRLLILDEADKLVSKAFLKDINLIFKSLPIEKQVILSSATFDEISKNTLNKYVQNAQHICPDSTSILLGIVQKFTVVKSNLHVVRQTQIKVDELLKILNTKSFKQCIIFSNYQARVSDLYKVLSKQNWPVEQLFGKQEQTERLDTIKTLKEYQCRVLVSTDLSARGIDASNVDLVINFEAPLNWQTYLHRIGRAGRFGSYGTAITILAEGKEFIHFKSMTDNMKINLTTLWDDDNNIEEINISENSQNTSSTSFSHPLHVDIQPKKSYEILWHTLTKADSNVPSITESFEKLCESFQKSDNNSDIESFSDLMESFNNSENTSASKTSYKHIKLDTIPQIKEYFIDIKDTQNDETYFNSLVESNVEQDTDKLKTNFNEFNRNTWKCDDDYNLNNHEALLKAGLPTEFSSHKQSQKTKRYVNRSNKNEKSNILTKHNLANHNTNLQYKGKGNINHRNEKYRHKSEETSSESSIEESHRMEFSRPILNCSSKLKHKNEASLIQNEKYTTWFKLLKHRVKQIEMMVYLDEMSRL